MFITSAPTELPTTSPVTFGPTISPSFIGLVVSIEVSRPTTGPLDESEIEHIQNQVMEAYGADVDDISSVTEYMTTGTIELTIPDDVVIEDALQELVESMASVLDIDGDSIDLSYDETTGVVTYTITTPDYDTSVEVKDALNDDSVVGILDGEAESISIVSASANDDIIAIVSVVVDGDELTSSLQQSENILDTILEDKYAVITESNPWISRDI